MKTISKGGRKKKENIHNLRPRTKFSGDVFKRSSMRTPFAGRRKRRKGTRKPAITAVEISRKKKKSKLKFQAYEVKKEQKTTKLGE
jgi:hypothetical protein